MLKFMNKAEFMIVKNELEWNYKIIEILKINIKSQYYEISHHIINYDMLSHFYYNLITTYYAKV